MIISVFGLTVVLYIISIFNLFYSALQCYGRAFLKNNLERKAGVKASGFPNGYVLSPIGVRICSKKIFCRLLLLSADISPQKAGLNLLTEATVTRDVT